MVDTSLGDVAELARVTLDELLVGNAAEEPSAGGVDRCVLDPLIVNIHADRAPRLEPAIAGGVQSPQRREEVVVGSGILCL